MKIDCLMGTYGRYSFACEALACFLSQTALSDATFLIYNQHPVPLTFSHPRVRIVNAQTPSGTTLRDIRAQMIELANPDAEFLHFWDDDDLYLPWHLEDCLGNIGEHVAWKPKSSWILTGGNTYALASSNFEGSWIFRAEYLKSAPMNTHLSYPDAPVYMQTLDNNLLATNDLSGRANYIYRWNSGQINHSGLDAGGSNEKQRQVMKYMQSVSTDVHDSGEMFAADLTDIWRHYLTGTKAHISQSEWDLNRRAVGLPDFAPTEPSRGSQSLSGLVQRFNPFRTKR